MNTTDQPVKTIIVAAFLIMLTMTGCENKKAGLPNDPFREAVIPKITDQLNVHKFDTLLINLDKKGISYCHFVQRLSELEDSCYDVAKRKYPDPENEEDFVKKNLQAFKEAESIYLTEVNITLELSRFATSEYGSDQHVRSFCNNH